MKDTDDEKEDAYDTTLSHQRRGPSILRNRNQGEDKEAVIHCFIFAVGNAFIGERIVVAAVLQARPERPGHTLLQAGNERGAVNCLDLFIAMIDTNQHR